MEAKSLLFSTIILYSYHVYSDNCADVCLHEIWLVSGCSARELAPAY